jgi:radical SAM protein with 4Fe4S-binding SPASM domain
MIRTFMTHSLKALKSLATRKVEFECDRIPYRFTRVPLSKILNWICVEASVYAKPQNPWGMPTVVQIEPTTYCNLKCALCPVTEGLGRPPGFMNFDLYKRLVDEIGDYAFLILLWDWGEPSLHPDIDEMISYARQKGIKVVCSTNGHRFASPQFAERIVRSGLDTLIFALDGVSQETYQLYRRQGSLETVIRGIQTVIEKKHELNSATPFVNLRFIAMKYNEHEIPRVHDLAKSLGVNAVTLKTLYPGHDCDPAEDRQNPFIPEDRRYRRFRYDEAGFNRIRVNRNPCRALWNNPVIHWNGVVCPCSFDTHEKYVFGDLNQSSFKECWHGPAYRLMRRRFRDDWESIPLCSGCSYAYEGGNCACETIAEAHFLLPDGSYL